MISKTIIRLIGISLLTVNAANMAQSPLSKLNAMQEQPLDRIAVIVNDEIITQNEFNHALDAARQQFTQQHVPRSDEKVFQKQVIDQLIYQKLQLQLAKQSKIKVNDKEINIAIIRIAAQNQLSQSAFKEKLTQRGISYREFRSQIEKQLLISKLQQQVIANNITISKSDIVAFKKKHQAQITSARYHVATILIPVPKGTTATKAQINYAKDTAFLVLKQLHKGLSFESAMSAHPGSRDLGWWSINDLPQVFVSSIKKMKPNEVLGPIQAPNGFHLVKLLGKESQDMVNSRQIKQTVYQKKFEKALQKWLGQLRRSSYVRIYINS